MLATIPAMMAPGLLKAAPKPELVVPAEYVELGVNEHPGFCGTGKITHIITKRIDGPGNWDIYKL
jgi:hypothetical protein